VVRGKSKGVTDPITRADIFAASQPELEEVLEAVVATNPALTWEDEFLIWEAGPEDEPEDEGAPELLGEMGEDYGDDPDGDFSEPWADGNDFERPEDRVVASGVPLPGTRPDLVIIETTLDGHKIFEVELPDEAPTPVAQKGLPDSWRAGQTAHALEERREHLWRIGRIIITRQRAYFESSNPHEAYLQLQPLTQDEIARELGLNKGTVSRLLNKKFLQTPRFGVVALNLFFGPPGETLRLRTDVLAAHIRTILQSEDPQRPPYSSEQLRIRLQNRGLLPQTRTDKDKEQMERLLRRVMQDYNIQSRPKRRRSRA
jgi:hypothetical protein